MLHQKFSEVTFGKIVCNGHRPLQGTHDVGILNIDFNVFIFPPLFAPIHSSYSQTVMTGSIETMSSTEQGMYTA
jgi:hypothetical protein